MESASRPELGQSWKKQRREKEGRKEEVEKTRAGPDATRQKWQRLRGRGEPGWPQNAGSGQDAACSMQGRRDSMNDECMGKG